MANFAIRPNDYHYLVLFKVCAPSWHPLRGLCTLLIYLWYTDAACRHFHSIARIRMQLHPSASELHATTMQASVLELHASGLCIQSKLVQIAGKCILVLASSSTFMQGCLTWCACKSMHAGSWHVRASLNATWCQFVKFECKLKKRRYPNPTTLENYPKHALEVDASG